MIARALGIVLGLKRFKRVTLHCRNFASFIALAAGLILVKSLHTA
jgi:hypothetical protein